MHLDVEAGRLHAGLLEHVGHAGAGESSGADRALLPLNAGQRLIPPRYYDASAYEATIRRLRALDPELLLTAHYPVMERAAGREFLDRSLEFVRELRAAVRAAKTTELRAATEAVNAAVGPFPAFTHELAASVRAHLAEL